MNLGFSVQTCQHFIKKEMSILVVSYCSHSLSAESSGEIIALPELTCLSLLNQQDEIALRGFGQGISQLKQYSEKLPLRVFN